VLGKDRSTTLPRPIDDTAKTDRRPHHGRSTLPPRPSDPAATTDRPRRHDRSTLPPVLINHAAAIVVDFIHVLEYLWKAAYVFTSEGSKEAEEWVHERLARILRGQASSVAAGIGRSATMRKLTAAQCKNADKCAGYLRANAKYLRYHDYLRDGLPIATGVIEGACRHLIADSMDITGARWGLQGADSRSTKAGKRQVGSSLSAAASRGRHARASRTPTH